MGNKLPSHNVPLLLVADIICYINNNISYDIKKLQNFTSKSVAYVRSSLAICKLLNVIDEDENINQFADTLGKTPNDEIKVAVMRKFIHKLAVGLDMTVSELLDFPEMNETAFEDE